MRLRLARKVVARVERDIPYRGTTINAAQSRVDHANRRMRAFRTWCRQVPATAKAAALAMDNAGKAFNLLMRTEVAKW